MQSKNISPEELKAALKADIDRLVQQVAQAINNAQSGRIINDSEEPVRDANAEFRQRLYQKALDLLQDKDPQEDFSPSEMPRLFLVTNFGMIWCFSIPLIYSLELPQSHIRIGDMSA